jgi:putative endonuclease
MTNFAHQLGQAGEAAAAAFYQKAGYEVLAHGYRHGRAEVDLIVQRGLDLLVFVEVKTRSGGQYGAPETFVSARKKELSGWRLRTCKKKYAGTAIFASI